MQYIELRPKSGYFVRNAYIEKAKRSSAKVISGVIIYDGRILARRILAAFFKYKDLIGKTTNPNPAPGKSSLPLALVEAIVGELELEIPAVFGIAYNHNPITW